MSFELPKLPYTYEALEPHIDARTMEIHHSKHHNGYTTNLNNAISDTPMSEQSIEEILKHLNLDNKALRNNGGGYYNHRLFWSIMSPNGGGSPNGELAGAINDEFDSFDQFKTDFAKAAATQFGSGWAWLCVHKGGKLEICATANQDNPLMPGISCDGIPILGIDVWEHAYYKKFGPGRGDYVDAWWNVVNWAKVEDRFNSSIQ